MTSKTKIVKQYFDEILNEADCELKFSSNLDLLVAVILSAQCTDKQVNKTTKQLFAVCKTPEDYVKLGQTELEKIIHSCGFYHNKAKNIIAMCNSLIKDFQGEVPQTITELMSLAGVGQKTANVVYSMAFKGDAFAVDTHVFRVANRIGLTKAKDVKQSEQQLCKVFDKKDWSKTHYQMVLFGRYMCSAKKPNCCQCKLKDICDYNKKEKKCF